MARQHDPNKWTPAVQILQAVSLMHQACESPHFSEADAAHLRTVATLAQDSFLNYLDLELVPPEETPDG